jgi:hypothetical protein
MNPSRTLSRLTWRLALVFVMLLMQQAGWRHSLEHLAHDDDAAPTHAACLLCVAHHVQDHGLAAAPPVIAAPAFSGHVAHADGQRAQCPQGVRLSYRSRAPPSSLSV